ncbi:MAG: ribonuclease Z [Bacteroidales bacterium]|nr:ribonuclease Z [Bacteroidales bacterium]
MNFTVTILGSNSAIPTLLRNPAAQVVNHNQKLFLIDCAEGTQIQMRKSRIRIQKVNHIFISHMHGDHFFGLIGLISSMHLMNKKDPLFVYGPPELKEVIDLQLRVTNTLLKYPLEFTPILSNTQKVIYENDNLQVSTIPLLHTVPSVGFLFREKKNRKKLNMEAIREHKIPVNAYKNLQRGDDYTDAEGNVVSNAGLTYDPGLPRKYAYCSDTAYNESVIPLVREADLLFHEATFAHDFEMAAAEKLHSTARQAAMIAAKAGVKKLVIGHFSNRYDDPSILVEEARQVFPETYAAEEGKTYAV